MLLICDGHAAHKLSDDSSDFHIVYLYLMPKKIVEYQEQLWSNIVVNIYGIGASSSIYRNMISKIKKVIHTK